MHHIACNYQSGPIGGPGCICVIITKKEKKELEEVRQITQEWMDQQGHNRCWYYPKLFAKLEKILGSHMTLKPVLPPRPEFEEECRKFQQQEYGVENAMVPLQILFSIGMLFIVSCLVYMLFFV